jgi:putative FmdB family regulatory protein
VPTYQYVCTDCGEPLEAVQKFSDDALTECPVCGGRLRKVFSAVGVVFKGSGFYRNDSRSTTTSSTPAGSSSKESSSSDSGKSSGDSAKKSDTSSKDSSSSSGSKASSPAA